MGAFLLQRPKEYLHVLLSIGESLL